MKRFDYKLQEKGEYLSITFNNWINKLGKKINRRFDVLKQKTEVNCYKSYDGSDSCRFSLDTIDRRKPWNIREILRLYIYLDRSRTEIKVSFCNRGFAVNKNNITERYYEFNNTGLKQIVEDTLNNIGE